MNVDLNTLSTDQIQILVAAFFVMLTIRAFYANTVRKTLLEIAEGNRHLKPAQAWLLVIPLFSIYWNFVVANRLSDSLTNEFFDRKIPEEENPGRKTGVWYAWFSALSNLPLPPFFLIGFGVLTLVYFIAYWVKVAQFRTLLVAHNHFRNEQEQKQRHETERTD